MTKTLAMLTLSGSLLPAMAHAQAPAPAAASPGHKLGHKFRPPRSREAAVFFCGSEDQAARGCSSRSASTTGAAGAGAAAAASA
jgi:hypothetical protein